jgi:hypothetical protein
LLFEEHPMKRLPVFFLMLGSLVGSGACGPQEGLEDLEASDLGGPGLVEGKADSFGDYPLGAGDPPVKLLRAHRVIGAVNPDGSWSPHYNSMNDFGYGAVLTSFVRGVVAVKDLGQTTREVVVHYQSKLSNDATERPWATVKATRVRGQLWEFKTAPLRMGSGYHYIPRFVHSFAVQYKAGSQEFWDNNNGANYVVSGDENGGWVPGHRGPAAVFCAGDLVVESAMWDGNYLSGSVIVKNLGYGKRVGFFYTTDGWRTTRSGEASYERSFEQSNLERWKFSVLAVTTHLEKVVFAVYVEANGTRQWDNNLGRNHALTLDGKSSPWALGPVASMGKVVFEGPAKGWAVRWVRKPAPRFGGLMLVYHSSRLTSCRGQRDGLPAWSITPYSRLDATGDWQEGIFLRDNGPQGFFYPLGATGEGYLHSRVIPTGNARSLELYFKNGDLTGCTAWDSNYSRNHLLTF